LCDYINIILNLRLKKQQGRSKVHTDLLKHDNRIIEFPHLSITAGITTTLMGDFKSSSNNVGKHIEILKNIYGAKYHKQLVPVHGTDKKSFTTGNGNESKEGDIVIYGNENIGYLCIVHCSWITLAANIFDDVLDALNKISFWFLKPQQKTFIYPGICQICYEVSKDVANKLVIGSVLHNQNFELLDVDHYLLNLSGFIRTRLIKMGVGPDITTIPTCSAHTRFSDTTSLIGNEGHLFYSHRARQEKERNVIFAKLPGDDNLITTTTGDCPYVIFYSPPN